MTSFISKIFVANDSGFKRQLGKFNAANNYDIFFFAAERAIFMA
jgi:hypothetical protein